MQPMVLRLLLALVACALIGLAATATPVQAGSSSDRYDWMLAVDAGSTGSRIHVFRWEKRVASSSVGPFSDPVSKPEWQ
jgi:hypothetical protein